LKSLFEVFDTDSNGLVDALELIICISVLSGLKGCVVRGLKIIDFINASGMDTVDKVNFAFNAYDFESTETLFFDEVTLLFRACARGLKKSCPSQAVFSQVTNAEAESYASLFFQNLQRDPSSEKINFLEFRSFCCTHPVISSWLKMVSAIPTSTKNGQASVGLDDLDVILYRSWPQYSVFDSELHSIKFGRVYNLMDLATRVTESDLPSPPSDGQPAASNANDVVSEAPSSEFTPFKEITAEEEEEQERAKAAVAEAIRIASLPPPPPLTWFKAADKGRPEELPPLRKDAAQDTLSALWIHGFGSSSAPRMRRAGCYDANGSIVYPASNHVISLKKDEEGVWSQKHLSEHKMPITCMDIDTSGTLLATGDRVTGVDDFGQPVLNTTLSSIVNIWNLKNGSIRGTITLPSSASGVRYVDFSADSKYLLVLLEDSSNTICIYDLETLNLVFTNKLFDPLAAGATVAERILDIKFCATNSIFATAGTFGVTFFVDEGASFMNPQGLKCYEKRTALYQKTGSDASSVVATALTRFEFPDELVSGTAVCPIVH
jgi:hypothetical protein